MVVESFVVAGDAVFYGFGGALPGEKSDMSSPLPDEVVGNDIAGPSIVQTDQIVIASCGIFKQSSIEQYDRNIGFIQGSQYAAVHLLARWWELPRAKENTGYFLLDIALAQLSRFFRQMLTR